MQPGPCQVTDALHRLRFRFASLRSDDRSFLARLRMLGERARDLTLLRSARTERPSHAERLQRDPERASRPLLVGESDALDELKQRAVEVIVDQRTFFVASIDDLISMKQRAGRPQDLLDIAELRRIRNRLG